jgi:arylsulfatase A-like enzyme
MRILYLDLDTLRPDHLSGYGYPRPTSPHLDSVIRRGLRFSRAFAQSSPCVPSRAALFSGRFDVHNGVVTHWGPGGELRPPAPGGPGRGGALGAPMLAKHLNAGGYRTVSVSSFADRHQAWWFCDGWSELYQHTLKRGDEVADEVNAVALPWLERNAAADNWLLHLQYWDVHRNYRIPEPQRWVDAVKDAPPPAWPDAATIARDQANPGPFTARNFFTTGNPSPFPVTMPDAVATRADFERLINGYDACLRYLDDRIGRVLAALRAQGVLEETAIIVSADHGEQFGELGVYGDHCMAASAVNTVPLVVAWPGVVPDRLAGAVCDDLVYNVDLPPTLAELLGLPQPAGWDGASLARQLRGEAAPDWRRFAVYSHGLYSCQRVVRTARWQLTRTYHPGAFPLDPVMLHDMEVDPYQTENLAAQHPEVVQELDHLLAGWLQEQLGRPGAAPDPLQQVVESGPWRYVTLDSWLQRLEGWGRPEMATAIRRRLGLLPAPGG